MNGRIRAGAKLVATVAALLLPFATPAAGQRADFLFHRPRVTAVLRGGWAAPRAQSDIFDFTVDFLTVDRKDFDGGAIELEGAVRVRDHVDLSLGLGHSEAEVRSEFRNLVEDDGTPEGRPIEQVTRFQRTPIEVGVKTYLKDRGRSISRYAWVPSTWAPYVAVGAGALVYDFDQDGDFVDYETNDIFTRNYESDGVAPTAHVAAGLDLSIGSRWLATGEGRYQWAHADLSQDFSSDFDPIDLSGFQVTVGVGVRF